jgi:hypothetical protein
MFPVYAGERLHLGGKRFAVDEDVETEMRKWLRQQSKDFYAADFDALVKRWDKCTNADGGYVEKMYFSGTNIHLWPIR